jgi:hypothetical protein
MPVPDYSHADLQEMMEADARAYVATCRPVLTMAELLQVQNYSHGG